MLPRRVKVKNFGPFSEVEQSLTEIFFAIILGKNGGGKSTLFTWSLIYALFGKTKNGCSVDDMVRKGAQEMLVQFDFEHQGCEYQVTRSRSLKGRGKPMLEFQKLVNGQWQSISGTTIVETEKKVQALLNLDADTFIASSMILQGDSANFSAKPPGERKSILSKVLGLGTYDQLQAAVRDKAKALEIELATDKNKLADLEENLKALPQAEQHVQDFKDAIALTATRIRDNEAALSDAQAEVKALETKEQQAKQINRQLDDISAAIRQAEDDITIHNQRITDAQAVLEGETEIATKVAELEQIKAKIPALQAKAERLNQVKAEARKLFDEGETLQNDHIALSDKIRILEAQVANRDKLEKASEEYQAGLITLQAYDDKAGKHQDLSAQLADVENRLAQGNADRTILVRELEQFEKKVAILADSGCIDAENATCKFLADAKEAQTRIPAVETRIQEADKALLPLYESRGNLIVDINLLNYDQAQHSAFKKQNDALRSQAEQYALLAGKEELLKNLKQQRENLIARQDAQDADIKKLQTEAQQIKAETKDMNSMLAQITELEKYVKLRDKLPEARTTIQLSQEAIAKLQADIDAKDEQHRQLLADYTTLSQQFAGLLPEAQQRITNAESEGKRLQVELNDLNKVMGTYQAKLDALQKDAKEKERLSAELAPKAKELTRWQTLVKAFGKNGVPALIIENAIPELERISNDILSQMSNGAHSLRFETQRDLKSKDGVAETLDIIVSDWAGSRPYETFSGGEQLRIDLAIRFALAELLANRAGSKIEFCILDEIFGSQDAEHRDMVIDAIKAVSNRFKMILVISHIAEVQGAFDQQIRIGEDGKVEVLFN
ncbi:MAG TPA: SMC family ATPase [Syntrophomonas sp.]|nr:SMC family ATPase [Syntrophomonas sp.]